MLTIVRSNRFLKDLRIAKKRNLDLSSLDEVVTKLAKQEPLDEKYHDHALSGDFSDFRECHVKPDWLLIYAKHDDRMILTATRTGTHSDLFGK